MRLWHLTSFALESRYGVLGTYRQDNLGPLTAEVARREHIEDQVYVTLLEDDFQTIKIQLLALGLIQKSSKRRSLKDTATYWSLTPYGEHYLTVLKAIPSDSALLS